MNQLLIMPRIVNKIGEWYNFPLGIAYVSSSLKKNGFNIYTLNLNNEEGNIEAIIRRYVEKYDIDIVSTGGLSFQYNAIKSIVDIAKHINDKIITIVGGGIITSAPEAAMVALENADYGVIGEGEITNSELSYVLQEKGDVSQVLGIIYKQGDKFVMTPKRKEIQDLDNIPYPDYKGFGFDKVLDTVASLQGINEKNAITMLSSRSCPYRCTFCFHSSGNKYRQRSLDNFFEEVEYLVNEYDIKYIFIADELFAYDVERVKEFCKRIKKYNIKWWAQFRVSDVTTELVDLLKAGNCAVMGFGIESADNGILKSMKKNITIEQTEKALNLVYEAGISIQGGLIFGDVEETIETATKTLNWWKDNIRYGLSLNFITTYPGTGLYKYAVEHGVIKDEVEFIKNGCQTINVSKMNELERRWLAEQIVLLPQLEMKEPLKLEKLEMDYNNATITVEGECVACGQKKEWNNIRLFTRNVLLCSTCGRKHKIPIPEELINKIDKILGNKLDKYGKIACWGINDYFIDVLRHSKVLKDERVYLVDCSELKQGSEVVSKKIYPAEVINQQDIKYVMIPVVAFSTSIKQEIETHFQQVEQAEDILEIIEG